MAQRDMRVIVDLGGRYHRGSIHSLGRSTMDAIARQHGGRAYDLFCPVEAGEHWTERRDRKLRQQAEKTLWARVKGVL